MEWISTNDRLPEHLTEVLTFKKNGMITIGFYTKTLDTWLTDMAKTFYTPTHWMPLPDKPVTA